MQWPLGDYKPSTMGDVAFNREMKTGNFTYGMEIGEARTLASMNKGGLTNRCPFDPLRESLFSYLVESKVAPFDVITMDQKCCIN